MKKINKKLFNEKFSDLIKDNIIPEIDENKIYEFKLGKSYFYTIKNDFYLNKAQEWINYFFEKNIPLNNSATAFRKEYSYLDFFEPHRKNYNFVRLDIKSFFHSIKIEDIKKIFKDYFEYEYLDKEKKQLLIDGFLNIITYKIPEDSLNQDFKDTYVLPMGFKTSPLISNIIFRRLDILIQNFCLEKDIVYTRYADDMLFSTRKEMTYIHNDNFINEISIRLSKMNFKLNNHKTVKAKNTISLNGYTIQYSTFRKGVINLVEDKEYQINELRLSNKKLIIIKKLIYMDKELKKSPKFILKKLFNYKLPVRVPSEKRESFYTEQLVNKLTGYRSYLLSIIVFNNRFNCCLSSTITKYSKMIDELDSLINKKLNT